MYNTTDRMKKQVVESILDKFGLRYTRVSHKADPLTEQIDIDLQNGEYITLVCDLILEDTFIYTDMEIWEELFFELMDVYYHDDRYNAISFLN